MSKEDKKDADRRPAPFLRHISAGPPGAAVDFLKEQLNKQSRSNFNSSSLDTPAIIGEKSQKNQDQPENSQRQEDDKNNKEDTNMASKSVNKTALHPGGVQSVSHSDRSNWGDADDMWNRATPEHTELEEELHDKARIDYDRVAIVRIVASLHSHILY